ncbi:cop9 signalosome complex subunit 3 [Ophiostoma piceae UAMH 11346]|uniref:Cop9 signalosome complex subunit 3 n=1 Tax=Ophiostoma piceae (strain UAMH 11346) TaxID=1262450 RepID=S3C8S3_OPHP1|nr:cop9 signalosome complex subunit 3 [Ophiostoma piceae UAMH 11346]
MLGVEKCLSVLAFPGDNAASLPDEAFDEQITSHKSRVEQLFEAESSAITAHAMELTKSLDPFKHTFSYLSILDAIIPTDSSLYPTMDQVLIRRIVAFLTHFDPRQVRYIGYGLTRLLSVLGSGAVMPAPITVKLITHALQTLDPGGHMLTSSHIVLAKLAYHSDTAALALPVLSKSIVFFPSNTPQSQSEPLCSLSLPPPAYISKDTGLTLAVSSGQILEYDYFIGNIYLSLGDYKEAIEAFGRVISHPSRDSSVSKIMVAAHKRWLLANLVHYGKTEGTPPHTAAAVSRVCSSVNKLYARIAELFQNASPADLCVEVSLAAEQLKINDDWSLVKQVVAAHKKWQVVRLRDVFLTISIADVIKTLHVPAETAAAVSAIAGPDEIAEASQTPSTAAEAVALIRGMIDAGMITAEIVESPGPAYLHFLPEQKWASEKEFSAALQTAGLGMAQVRQLNKLTSEQLSLNRDYIKQTLKDQKAAATAGNADDGAGDIHPGGYHGVRFGGSYDVELDEDLMMDGTNDYLA